MKRISKRLLISLSLIAMMAFAVGMGTYAYFTSQATSTSNAFTAGTLTVGLTANTSTTTPFSVSGELQPGDIVTKSDANTVGPTVIEIKNNGTLNLAEVYKFVTEETGTHKLSNMLYFTNLKFESLEPNGTTPWSPADDVVNNGDISTQFSWGNTTYYRDLAGADGKLSLAEWNAADSMGAGPGIGMGALKPNHSYKITFELKFDEAADNNYQGKNMNGYFVVYSTQITKNALDTFFDAHPEIGLHDVAGDENVAHHWKWLNDQIALQ